MMTYNVELTLSKTDSETYEESEIISHRMQHLSEKDAKALFSYLTELLLARHSELEWLLRQATEHWFRSHLDQARRGLESRPSGSGAG